MQKRRTIEQGGIVLSDEEGNVLLTLKETLADQTMQFVVKGNLITEVIPDFEDELMAALTVSQEIVIDMSGVDFISSAGLKVLLSLQQLLDEEKRPQLRLKKLTKRVQQIFEDTGFDGLFLMEDK